MENLWRHAWKPLHWHSGELLALTKSHDFTPELETGWSLSFGANAANQTHKWNTTSVIRPLCHQPNTNPHAHTIQLWDSAFVRLDQTNSPNLLEPHEVAWDKTGSFRCNTCEDYARSNARCETAIFLLGNQLVTEQFLWVSHMFLKHNFARRIWCAVFFSVNHKRWATKLHSFFLWGGKRWSMFPHFVFFGFLTESEIDLSHIKRDRRDPHVLQLNLLDGFDITSNGVGWSPEWKITLRTCLVQGLIQRETLRTKAVTMLLCSHTFVLPSQTDPAPWWSDPSWSMSCICNWQHIFLKFWNLEFFEIFTPVELGSQAGHWDTFTNRTLLSEVTSGEIQTAQGQGSAADWIKVWGIRLWRGSVNVWWVGFVSKELNKDTETIVWEADHQTLEPGSTRYNTYKVLILLPWNALIMKDKHTTQDSTMRWFYLKSSCWLKLWGHREFRS